MKKRKKNSFPVKPALLLGAAALLLLSSTVGSTRAALTYYSDNYAAQIEMSSIGVALLENKAEVSGQNYGDNATTTGTLLKNMLSDGEKFTPGKPYDEALSVRNTGDIDTFVRVIITKSWQDAKGKDTTLAPSLIDFNILENTGWVVDDSTDYSDERIVLYYTQALAPGEETEALSDTIRIEPEIAQSVTVGEDGKYEYVYNGYSFHLEAEVDAVQMHNAEDAIKSAWGVDVTVSDDGRAITLN
ncbi:hypothetical protein [Lachnoclostridium sp. An138]|uniref:hypothetical protein n=1 Tax=Lachnoclostridium sp. An138 TaxID=1965560 RepID=UPI000B3AB89B|nr:hypothetical protein [Lachnoclostridium sp. An138]OUQ15931.1 hypothetical protein B5E82_14585 [Lachnoclostridium sp. An138]